MQKTTLKISANVSTMKGAILIGMLVSSVTNPLLKRSWMILQWKSLNNGVTDPQVQLYLKVKHSLHSCAEASLSQFVFLCCPICFPSKPFKQRPSQDLNQDQTIRSLQDTHVANIHQISLGEVWSHWAVLPQTLDIVKFKCINLLHFENKTERLDL